MLIEELRQNSLQKKTLKVSDKWGIIVHFSFNIHPRKVVTPTKGATWVSFR
jgi:hypothetical protein